MSRGNRRGIPTMPERIRGLSVINRGVNGLTRTLRLTRALFTMLSIMTLVCACSKSGPPPSDRANANLLQLSPAFSCTHELSHLPALNADADKLFVYAR